MWGRDFQHHPWTTTNGVDSSICRAARSCAWVLGWVHRAQIAARRWCSVVDDKHRVQWLVSTVVVVAPSHRRRRRSGEDLDLRHVHHESMIACRCRSVVCSLSAQTVLEKSHCCVVSPSFSLCSWTDHQVQGSHSHETRTSPLFILHACPTMWGGGTQLRWLVSWSTVWPSAASNVANLSFHFIFTGEPSSTDTLLPASFSSTEH